MPRAGQDGREDDPGGALPGSGTSVFPLAERLRHHQTIPPTMTATARIAKAIQPHCVLLDSSCCDAAAAAAATAAGLSPDVVVAPETVVVAGGGVTATTVVVVVSDSVTVGIDRVGAVTVGVDLAGAVTDCAGRVAVVPAPEFVTVPTAEPFPPPQAVKNPTASDAIIAALTRRPDELPARPMTTGRRSHALTADSSPDSDEQPCDRQGVRSFDGDGGGGSKTAAR